MREFSKDRYEKMSYRRCGRSGLKLPEVSLGFWQNLGKPDNADLCRTACYESFDAGITHFDLANNYGPPPGAAESAVGKILRDMPRDELIISTKAGYTMWDGPYGDWGSKKYMVASLDQSLKRLGLDYVDIYYHHRPDPETPLQETLGAMDLIVRQGKALYIGLSNYPSEEFARAVAICRENSWTPITIHQPSYSMLNRWVEDDGLLEACQANGTGVIAFCPLHQGVLTSKYLSAPPVEARFARSDHYETMKSDGTLEKVRQLNAIAEKRGQSLASLALQWILRRCEVTSVVIGISKIEQLRDNLTAVAAAKLTSETITEIEKILQH